MLFSTAAHWGLLIRRTEGRRERTEKEGKGVSPKVEMTRIKH